MEKKYLMLFNLILFLIHSSLFGMNTDQITLKVICSNPDQAQKIEDFLKRIMPALEDLQKDSTALNKVIDLCDASARSRSNYFLAGIINPAIPTIAMVGAGIALTTGSYLAKYIYKKYIAKSDSLNEIQKKLELSHMLLQLRNYQQNAITNDIGYLESYLNFINQCPDENEKTKHMELFNKALATSFVKFDEYQHSIKYLPGQSAQSLVTLDTLKSAGIFSDEE